MKWETWETNMLIPRRFSQQISIIIIGLFVLVSPGCSADSSENIDSEGIENPRLPVAMQEADCERETPPDPCTWVMANDAVFIGTVEEINVITDAVVAESGADPYDIQDSCNGVVNNGLALELNVDEVLSGSGIATTENISVKIGYGQLQSWNPFPTMEDGDLVWEGDEEGFISEGMTIGMGVRFHSDYDEWSLMGGPLFQIDEDTGLEFQTYHLECLEAPDQWNGFDIDELKDAASSCEQSPEADERYDLMYNMWADPPQNSVAGVCIPSDTNTSNDTECDVDMDCGPEEQCTDGECVPDE